jgi:nitrate reductase molybdenum cofactor assembly chaperone NarJ/NarW
MRLLKHLGTQPALDVESEYVELFDRGRRTALHLFEHVHGDSRDRGPAMIDLIQTYEKGGLFLAPSELPDHLSVLLEFASTQPPQQAREFLGEIAHIVRVIFSALLKRQSPYASVLAAVLELAGEKAEAVAVAPSPKWTRAGPSPRCSAAAPPKARPNPASRSRSAFVRKNPNPLKERRHEHAAQLPLQRLSLHLPGGVPHGQPGPLRPRPVHLEKRFVAAAAQAPAALGQQPVPHRHPVPVLRPHRGPAHPHFVYEPFITPGQKQMVAVVAGGIAGVICFIGLTCCCTAASLTTASA